MLYCTLSFPAVTLSSLVTTETVSTTVEDMVTPVIGTSSHQSPALSIVVPLVAFILLTACFV